VPLANLNADEVKVVGECLHAAAYGPFFPDWEFQALFGLSREEMQVVADRFPDVDEHDDDPGEGNDQWLAINNSFTNLMGYPHGATTSTWSSYISISQSELRPLFDRWRGGGSAI
jgi:hypothetical protein